MLMNDEKIYALLWTYNDEIIQWIVPPSGLDIKELSQWLFGYLEAIDDIVEIIESLQEGVKD